MGGQEATPENVPSDAPSVNAEFQHFILRFNKISLLRRYH